MPSRPSLDDIFGGGRPSLGSIFGDEEETPEERRRRLFEERQREMREMGALPTEAVPEQEERGLGDYARFGVAAARENLASLVDLPTALPEIAEKAVRVLTPKPLENAALAHYGVPVQRRIGEAIHRAIPEPMLSARERAGEQYEEEREEFLSKKPGTAERAFFGPLDAITPGLTTAVGSYGTELAAGVLDPLEALPGGAVLGAVSKAQKARRALGAVEDVADAAADVGRVAERRGQPKLRAEVDALLPTLAGKTRPELRDMLDDAPPGSALEKAIERAAEQLETSHSYAAPRVPAAPAPASAEEAAAKAAAFRARVEAKSGPRAPAATGETARVFGPAGEPFEVQYHVVELDDLEPSHRLVAGRSKPNPLYPPWLQPRDRTRIATAEQVDEMARGLVPEKLLDHPDIDAGAPIVDADFNVLSGNARSMGIGEAYRRGLDEPYRLAVQQRAPALGINVERLAGMRRPVLVRTLVGDVEPRGFAELANKPRSMTMAASEQALADARRLSPTTLEGFVPNAAGDMATPGNRDFVRTVLAEIAPSPAERSALQTATGELSQEGARRVRGAVLAAAFPDPEAVGRLIEATDDNIKGAGRAMLANAPKIAGQRAAMAAGTRFPQLDIAPAAGEAAAKLSALRAAGEPVERFLAQAEMVPSLQPLSREVLGVMHEHRRSPRRLTAVLHRYTELVDEAGDPRQSGLFGAAEPPDPIQLLKRANQEADLAGQRSIFEAGPAESAIAEPAEQYVSARARAVEAPAGPDEGVVRSPLGQPAAAGEALRAQLGAAPELVPGLARQQREIPRGPLAKRPGTGLLPQRGGMEPPEGPLFPAPPAPPPPPFGGAPPGGQRPIPPRLAALVPKPTTVAGRSVATLRRFLADNFVSESAGAALEFRDPNVRRYIARELPLRKEQAQQEAARLEIAAKPAFSRYERAVRDHARGDRDVAARLRAETTAARTSGDWSKLPEPVANAGQEIGKLIDNLSQGYVDAGLLTKRQQEIFRANLGTYMHRSYQAFDAPGFFEAVRGTESWRNAFRYLRDSMPEATDEELAGTLWQLATREEQKPPPAFGRRAFPRKDLTNLVQRQDIAEPIRELMGEYDDYLLNAGRTVGKMAYDLAMHRMLKVVAGELESMGVAVRPRRVTQTLPDGNEISRTVSPGGERMAAEIVGGNELSPLDGLRTTPDLARFFNEVGAAAHTGGRLLFERATAGLKVGKTVYSPATQLRNAESWVLMTLSQARGLRRMMRGGSPISLPGTESGRNLMLALRAVGGELAADIAPASRLAATLDESAVHAKLLRSAELGVTHTGTLTGELAEWRNMFAGGSRAPVPLGSPRVERARAAVGVVDRAGGGLYRASDDAGKFYNWLEEIEDLRWMHNDGRADALLEAEAAEIVKQQLQTYGRSIPLARKLARNPLVGPFVTFQFEMPRNLINATKRGAYEIDLWRKTGNTRALAMGTARLAGVGSGFTALAGLNMAIGTLGATAAGKAIGLGGAEHTSDDVEAVRRLTAPAWARYATPLILNIDGDSVTYVDGSGIDPYSIVPQIAVALTEPDGAPEKLYALADVVTQRFLAPELAAKAAVEFVTKTRIEGPLWDAQSREQTGNRAYNMWRTLGPGGALLAENVARGAELLNPERGHGRRYELKSELVASMGPRIQTFSFEGSFKGRTKAWNQARTDISGRFTTQAARARPGTDDILAAKKEAEQEWGESWAQMQDWTSSARQLLSHQHPRKEVEDRLWRWLRDSDVSAVVARQLLAGQYMSYSDYRNRTAARGSGKGP